MIDNFSILLSHGLLLYTFWLLIQRDDCDVEEPPVPDTEPEGFAGGRPKAGQIKRPDTKNPMRRSNQATKAGGAADA